MDASHQEDLQVQRMSLWLLNVDSEMEIFRGALDSFQQLQELIAALRFYFH